MHFIRQARNFVKRELRSWQDAWQPTRAGRQRGGKVHLELESLEDRCVPTGGTWAQLQNAPLYGGSNMMLLTDGSAPASVMYFSKPR